MSVLIALYLQAAVAVAPGPAAPGLPPGAAVTSDPALDQSSSTVSGVIVSSPGAKAPPPKVYTPTYKAAPHLGSGDPQISGSATIDQTFGAYFGDTKMRTNSLAALTVSQYAAQRHRAKKAADLINAGHCPEALQGVYNEGDTQLIVRVAEVCELPLPMARPNGPPF